MPMTKDNIIHRANTIETIQIQQTTIKGQTSGAPNYQYYSFYLPHLQHEVQRSSRTEHPENLPLSGSVRLRYCTWS